MGSSGLKSRGAPSRRFSMKPVRLAFKGVLKQAPLAMWHAYYNRRYATAAQKIIVTRNSAAAVYEHATFLAWMAAELPEARAHFELRVLPVRDANLSSCVLHASWAGDRLSDWPPGAMRHEQRLERECDRRGIPVINRLERLANCGKSAAARIIAGVGIRTPRMTRISSIDELRELLEGLEPPLLIREEYGHGERSVLISERREIERVDLSRFRQPIAVEFIDVRDDAGLYRKYRYIALGTSGIVRHMMVNRQWEVRPERRVINDLLRDEELTYLGSPDPNEGLLQCARAALGMDVVGFDYSYDRQGRMVVWEANPFPDFNYPNPELASHIFPVVKRCFAGLVKLYFERAGLPAPNKALDLLAAGFSAGSAARPRAVAA